MTKTKDYIPRMLCHKNWISELILSPILGATQGNSDLVIKWFLQTNHFQKLLDWEIEYKLFGNDAEISLMLSPKEWQNWIELIKEKYDENPYQTLKRLDKKEDVAMIFMADELKFRKVFKSINYFQKEGLLLVLNTDILKDKDFRE